MYERCLYDQVLEYFENRFPKFQYGFCKGYSAQHCLPAMTEKWKKPLHKYLSNRKQRMKYAAYGKYILCCSASFNTWTLAFQYIPIRSILFLKRQWQCMLCWQEHTLSSKKNKETEINAIQKSFPVFFKVNKSRYIALIVVSGSID